MPAVLSMETPSWGADAMADGRDESRTVPERHAGPARKGRIRPGSPWTAAPGAQRSAPSPERRQGARMDILGTIWFCLLAALGFGFVIFIHELGHFLFAKWAGVRVDRFSIGFAPVIFRKQIGETEYALSLLPLGGYVKMLGQEDTPAEIPGEAKTDPRSYLAKSWKWQSAILLGGVLFNLVSSYLILIGIAWYGKPTIEPVVGSVIAEIKDEHGHPQPSPAAQAGLRVGDRILSINGQPMREFDNIQMAIISSGRQPLAMTVERRDAAGKVQELRRPAGGRGLPAAPNSDQGRRPFGFGRMEGVEVLQSFPYSGQPSADAPRFGG